MTEARYETADNVLTVTLDGPQHKNSLTFELYADLRDRFRALNADASGR
jgi:enoyl-CoA hydratase/carnithine racemase